MRDFFELLGSILCMLTLVIGGIFGIAYMLDKTQCDGFSSATGYETKYRGLNCYAKYNGQWVPKEYVFGKALEVRKGDQK